MTNARDAKIRGELAFAILDIFSQKEDLSDIVYFSGLEELLKGLLAANTPESRAALKEFFANNKPGYYKGQ